MKTYSTPTKRDSRSLDDLSWGDIGDYYPPEEHTLARVAAWTHDERAWEYTLDDVKNAIEENDEAAAEKALRVMERIEKNWGDSPTTDRAREIVGVYFGSKP